ncbi:MAG: ShlB/FhaC/HecB family hemolysin secretion/activation protein [Candidatus Omnitrophica bacterium]|nr:ShlB/FhaC/HecB family hemolysin secretion/activation protein [Candidatus Omnitrophota bacterium]
MRNPIVPSSIFLSIVVPSFVFFFFNSLSVAAPLPPPQEIGSQERARQMQEEEKKLENEVKAKKKKVKIEEETLSTEPENPQAMKVLVKKIHVNGVFLFSNKEIESITNSYINQELTIKKIQEIANRITNLYRKKGYVISRAYIPAHKMANGVLEINVIEAKIGDIQIKGNRYHATRLISRDLTIQKGDDFNYKALKKDLDAMNVRPDRVVKAVLAPGKASGTSDVLFDVKDAQPFHVQIGYSNSLSRYLRSNIYDATFIDNSLLGQDDVMTFQYARGDNHNYYSYTANYLYPITRSLNMGIYGGSSKEHMAGEFGDLGARGKSRSWGAYGSQELYRDDNIDSHFNFGFDYMDVYNFLNGEVSSRDRLRVGKGGFDFSISDDWGRTLIMDEYDYGIPGIMGGTPDHPSATDTPTSRSGAGGQFVKDTLNLLRLQVLPLDSTLLWKNQFQFSTSTLTSTEQYQVGGPANNRGYGVSEAVGDEGYSMSWELSEPLYFLSKDVRVPFSQVRWYDALRVIEFYDWSNVHLNVVSGSEEKNKTLSSAGCGLKFNVLRNVSASYEVGWPFQRTSDRKGVHHWFEVRITY